jgi:hypothetical protein
VAAATPTHQRQRDRDRDHRRGSTTQRGYGHEHQALRRQLLPYAYGTPCPRCDQVMRHGQDLDLGHSDPAARWRGEPGDRIEHADCNRGKR